MANPIGSSPRVWGQVFPQDFCKSDTRIIPTRVGTREVNGILADDGKDHPLACGDKSPVYSIEVFWCGSSPRVWGQDCKSVATQLLARIIPTRVGTSQVSSRKSSPPWDHPHACGDKIQKLTAVHSVTVSSPRVWGQDAEFTADIEEKRIIPTRVGTRHDASRLEDIRKDHPHACGDKQSLRVRSVMPMGSSPRVWGQDIIRKSDFCIARIIPTRVGTRNRVLILTK